MDRDRERLRELGAQLVPLHALLMERERRAYESRYGAVRSHELLRLLVHDERFAWLRSLSGLMARIEELLDAEELLVVAHAQSLFREAYALLKSGDTGAFHDKYREALQESPDVVMTHAGISKLLRSHQKQEMP
jgi:hypothetical protein